MEKAFVHERQKLIATGTPASKATTLAAQQIKQEKLKTQVFRK